MIEKERLSTLSKDFMSRAGISFFSGITVLFSAKPVSWLIPLVEGVSILTKNSPYSSLSYRKENTRFFL